MEERLAELESEQHWEKGRAAFEWLRSAAQSAYKHFLQGHRAFLRQREAQVASGDVDINEPIKWLPLRFMETAGLECAVWPHLYWKTEMTETWTRSQDVRRQARLQSAELSQMDWEDRILIREEKENRRRLARAPRGDSSSSSEGEAEADEEAEPEERKRTSAKASFVAKIFSPVMGYGACYELQHFVYDLWLASSLGGARNASNTTLRGALAGRVFSPMYWQTQHAALVDCVRQIGLPHLFITIAPLEASAPYHAWMQDELEKLLRTRTRLPGAETFHLAHLLMQAAEGLLGGTNQRKKGSHALLDAARAVGRGRRAAGPGALCSPGVPRRQATQACGAEPELSRLRARPSAHADLAERPHDGELGRSPAGGLAQRGSRSRAALPRRRFSTGLPE